MGDADNGGGYACVWAGGLWEISEPSSPFCCEPKIAQKTKSIGTSLVVQWLRLWAPNAEGLGLIPGQGTRSHMRVTTESSHAATKAPASHN